MGGYKRIITCGSSKGGTCALYFGLLLNADEIYSGACQYNLGTYLSAECHRRIFEGMMGSIAGIKEISDLNDIMRTILEKKKDCKSRIFVLYSKIEPTYEQETKYLLRDLYRHKYCVQENIENFPEHSMVGNYFPQFVKDNITIK